MYIVYTIKLIMMYMGNEEGNGNLNG